MGVEPIPVRPGAGFHGNLFIPAIKQQQAFDEEINEFSYLGPRQGAAPIEGPALNGCRESSLEPADSTQAHRGCGTHRGPGDPGGVLPGEFGGAG